MATFLHFTKAHGCQRQRGRLGYLAATNCLRRVLLALGLDRKPRDITPSLQAAEQITGLKILALRTEHRSSLNQLPPTSSIAH
jgi:hypothetical protein